MCMHIYVCIYLYVIFLERKRILLEDTYAYIYTYVFLHIEFYSKYVSAFSSCLSTEIVILLVCLFAFSVVA